MSSLYLSLVFRINLINGSSEDKISSGDCFANSAKASFVVNLDFEIKYSPSSSPRLSPLVLINVEMESGASYLYRRLLSFVPNICHISPSNS